MCLTWQNKDTYLLVMCVAYHFLTINVLPFFLHFAALQDLDAESAAAKRRPLVALSREAFADYFRIVSGLKGSAMQPPETICVDCGFSCSA